MTKTKKKKPAAKPVAPSDVIEPTPERLRKYVDEPDKFVTDKNRVIKRLNPVDTLRSANEISGEGYLACATYLVDWYNAGFAGKGGIDLSVDRVDGGGGGDAFSVKRIDAAKRFGDATAAIGPESARALRLMVLDDISLTAFARDVMLKNGQSVAVHAKTVLIKAINKLADFYYRSRKRRKAETNGGESKTTITSFMAEGARPQVQPVQDNAA